MFYALTWLLTAGLFTIWSLTAWALHALIKWSGSHAGGLADLPGRVSAQVLPEWLAAWLPPAALEPLASMLTALRTALESLLAYAPAAIGWLSPVLWVVWAIGSVLLLVTGVVVSGLIKLMKRKQMATLAT